MYDESDAKYLVSLYHSIITTD